MEVQMRNNKVTLPRVEHPKESLLMPHKLILLIVSATHNLNQASTRRMMRIPLINLIMYIGDKKQRKLMSR
jgi:hypothetical protein